MIGCFIAAEAKRLLLGAGYQLLKEEDEWKVMPGGRYFFTRNMSTIIAFAIGEKCAKNSLSLSSNYLDYSQFNKLFLLYR